MKHTFCIGGDPPKVTSQTKRIVIHKGKPMFFPKKEYAEAKKSVMGKLQVHKPAEPWQGPIQLIVSFIFPWRSGESQKVRNKGILPCDRRPDCDNLIKLIADCMTDAGFWTDDGQIYDLRVAKYWGDTPGILVEIRDMADAEELLA